MTSANYIYNKNYQRCRLHLIFTSRSAAFLTFRQFSFVFEFLFVFSAKKMNDARKIHEDDSENNQTNDRRSHAAHSLSRRSVVGRGNQSSSVSIRIFDADFQLLDEYLEHLR